MKIPFYSAQAILSRYNLRLLMKEIGDTYEQFKPGEFVIPQRRLISEEKRDCLFVSMPALSYRHELFINKTGTFFPRESMDSLPAINALVMAFSSRTGEPLALLEGNSLTQIKCAAISALVTDYCASPNARTLAIVGAGVQARQQFLGVCLVRGIKEIRIYNRGKENLKRFADEIRAIKGNAVKVVEENVIEQAIEGADIIGTTTSCSTPLSAFANLAPHVHINSIGAYTPNSREIPVNVLKNSLLIVEDIPTAIEEAGELHRKAVDLSQLLKADTKLLQKTRTIFSSTGHALLDIIAVAHILSLADSDGSINPDTKFGE
ncbi:ornithine cyclodeaminase [Coxiella burnetii]|nr:ornithine cyclodeaminase family protein [Coxiella burnetii]OYK79583.1 ornithine cyclodeaminase [Coxiella burnetii]OYK81665.1 ornithine cyclodeaminase [Coxiella burnetii]